MGGVKVRIDWNKKYTTIAVYVFLTVVAIFLFLSLIIYNDSVMWFLGKTVVYLSPVIYGIIIAYLLSPIDKLIYKFITRLFSKNKKQYPKVYTVVSLILTYMVFLGILVGFVFLILPDIGNSITEFTANIQKYSNSIVTYLNNLHLPFLDKINLEEFIGHGFNFAKDFLPKAYDAIYGVVTQVLNIAIGLLISIYVLAGRISFKKKAKKLLYAWFERKTVSKIVAFCREINRVFGGFISGKILDSTIIGFLAFVGLWLLRMPNPALMALIIGVTNVIPIFGPFIGAIPTGLMVLALEPEKTIWFIIFVIALQQLDGNFIGPKILGESTGLPSFWVIFALLLFGGFFGIVGMIIAVPVFALIFLGIDRASSKRLKEKGLCDSDDFYESELSLDGAAVKNEDENTGDQ